MNDPILAIDRLRTLLDSAMTASSESDRAAIYGAVRWLIHDLESHCADRCPYLGENIERARSSLCAILGYDITGGHSNQQHYSWALSSIAAIRRGLVK